MKKKSLTVFVGSLAGRKPQRPKSADISDWADNASDTNHLFLQNNEQTDLVILYSQNNAKG
jgi:hypothetical protein